MKTVCDIDEVGLSLGLVRVTLGAAGLTVSTTQVTVPASPTLPAESVCVTESV